jgi:antitoxin (DNA-binding transcriptional repressor) of toxin-antitoxin stability system
MSTKTINLQETSADLEELLTLVAEGTNVVLMRGETPIARLSPLKKRTKKLLKPRIPGLGAGDVLYISEDFDAPLPDAFWLGEDE